MPHSAKYDTQRKSLVAIGCSEAFQLPNVCSNKSVQLVIKHARVPETVLPFGHTDLRGGTSSPIATMLDRIPR